MHEAAALAGTSSEEGSIKQEKTVKNGKEASGKRLPCFQRYSHSNKPPSPHQWIAFRRISRPPARQNRPYY